MKKEFSKDNWKKALDTFSNMVKEKRYAAVPYEMWRKYSKLTNVRVVYEKNVVGIFSIQKEESSKSAVVDFLPVNDRSFGEYLYIFFFLITPKEEEKELILNTVGVEALKSSDYVVDCVIASTNSVEERICDIEKAIDKLKPKPEKEDKNMKNFNFDFGPCTNDQCHVSMYGIAVKNAAGVYVSYNPNTKEIVDVDILNFEGAKYMYKIPVALNDIAVGDVIIHNRKPMFVISLSTDGSNNLTCVDVCAGEQKTIVPTVNMFGFNFVTKIVSLFNMMGNGTPSPEHPFGNMLPFMLMGDNKNIDPMMLMMMNGNAAMNNPAMLYLMIKDNKDIDPMMFMFMSGAFNNTQPHVCNCANSKC